MRHGIEIEVSAADRAWLKAVVADRNSPQKHAWRARIIRGAAAGRAWLEAVGADRNSPQKHAWRARIILATADGLGTGEVMRRAGVSKPSVWRWQERVMREGVGGRLR